MNGGQVERFGARRSAGDPPNLGFIDEQPRLSHPDRHNWDGPEAGSDGRDRCTYLSGTVRGRLGFSIAMHDDQVEGVVERKNGTDAVGDSQPWRGVESPQVRGNHVHVNAVSPSQLSDMAAQRRV